MRYEYGEGVIIGKVRWNGSIIYILFTLSIKNHWPIHYVNGGNIRLYEDEDPDSVHSSKNFIEIPLLF
jgi:hypothetical protein